MIEVNRIIPRLLLGLVLVGPLPMGVLALLQVTFFEATLRETVFTNIDSISRKKTLEVNSYVAQRVNDGKHIARSADTRKIFHELQGLSIKSEQYKDLVGRHHDYFRGLFDSGDFYDLLLIDAQGNVIYSILHEPDFGTNMIDGPYRNSNLAQAHRKAMDLLDSQITSVANYEPSKGLKAIFLVTPVFEKGQVLGTVAVQLSLRKLTRIASEYMGLGKTGETLFGQMGENGPIYLNEFERTENKYAQKPIQSSNIDSPMIRALKGNFDHGIVADNSGKFVVASWRYFPALGWGMVVKIDKDEAFAPAVRMRNSILTAIALLFFLIAILAFRMGRGFVGPIRALTEATQKIAAGDLNIRVVGQGALEFQALANSFNQMADRLNGEQQRLEGRVQERTQALLQSEKRLQNILDGTNAGTWEWDIQSGEVLLNEYWSSMLGYKLEELNPMAVKTWESLCHPEDRAKAREILFEHFSGKRSFYDCELRMHHKLGHWVWVLARGKLNSRLANGKPGAISGTQLDITENKKIYKQLREQEEALRASESRWRLLLNEIPVGVAIVDPYEQIIFRNSYFVEMFGYSSLDALDLSSWYALAFPDRDYATQVKKIWEAAFATTLDSHSVMRPEIFSVRCKNGTVKKVEISGIGTEAGFLITFADHTLHQQHQEDLKDATAVANAASQAKGIFLANMSHEIRTPMNGILGMLNLLERTDLKPKQLDYTKKAIGATKALLGIINDILDYSKIEARKMTLDLHEFRVADLMRDLAIMLPGQVANKKVELLFDFDPKIPPLLIGDSLRLRQVLLNLAGNALKFTDKGEVVLGISSLPLSTKRISMAFSVVDTGIGIASEKLQEIFEGFNQAESSISRRFGGTGLGLAISKKLVEIMGGELKVESELGKGSHFSFVLQMDLAEKVQQSFEGDFENLLWGSPNRPIPASTLYHAVMYVEESGSVDSQSDTGAIAQLSGLRLLVVEDNVLNQQIALELLSQNGALVEIAGDGLEGVQKAVNAKPPFDAILMDLQMPGLDGMEAARKILAVDEWKEYLIIAMSANAMKADIDSCKAAGMVDHIAKPIDLDNLIKTLLAHTGSSMTAASEIEFKNAFKRLGGNKKLYQRLLDDFEGDARERLVELNRTIKANNWEDAARAAHTLKGSASSIGATRLVKVASEAEKYLGSLKEASPERANASQKFLIDIELALNIVSTQIRHLHIELDQEPEDQGTSPGTDMLELKNSLGELLELLKSKNMRALKFCKLISKKCGKTLADEFAQLENSLQNLDFDTAVETCKRLLQKI